MPPLVWSTLSFYGRWAEERNYPAGARHTGRILGVISEAVNGTPCVHWRDRVSGLYSVQRSGVARLSYATYISCIPYCPSYTRPHVYPRLRSRAHCYLCNSLMLVEHSFVSVNYTLSAQIGPLRQGLQRQYAMSAGCESPRG